MTARAIAYFDRLDPDLCIKLCEQLQTFGIDELPVRFLVSYLVQKQSQIRRTGREVTPNQVLEKMCSRSCMVANFILNYRKWEKKNR